MRTLFALLLLTTPASAETVLMCSFPSAPLIPEALFVAGLDAPDPMILDSRFGTALAPLKGMDTGSTRSDWMIRWDLTPEDIFAHLTGPDAPQPALYDLAIHRLKNSAGRYDAHLKAKALVGAPEGEAQGFCIPALH